MSRHRPSIVALALLLGACGEPEPPPAARNRAVIERILGGDEALYAHVRVAENGEIRLRTFAAEDRRWTERSTGRLGGAPSEEDATLLRVLSDLRRALAPAHAATQVETDEVEEVRAKLLEEELPDLPLEEEEVPDLPADSFAGAANARLMVEAEALVPWGRVQWMLQVAMNPRLKIHRWSFLAPDGSASVDARPLEEWLGRPGSTVPIRVVTAYGFREVPEPPAMAFTRVRLTDRIVLTDHEEDDLNAGPVREAVPVQGFAVDLVGDVAGRWREIEDHLRAFASGDPVVRAAVKAPPPGGLSVPYGDMFRLIRALRVSAGARVYVAER